MHCFLDICICVQLKYKSHSATLKQLSESISVMENRCNYALGRKLLLGYVVKATVSVFICELLHMSGSQEFPQKHVYTNYNHAWLTMIRTLTLG